MSTAHPRFAGRDQCHDTRTEYIEWRKWVMVQITKAGLEHVTSDEALHAPGMMPDYDAPSDAELQAKLMKPPEGEILTFQDQMRIAEINSAIERAHEAKLKAYQDRVTKYSGDLSKAFGILLENLQPGSPAASLVEAEAAKHTANVFVRFREAWARLDEKWRSGGSTASEEEILKELREATTEKYNVANRNAAWLSLTDRLREVEGASTSDKQLYDIFCKGVKDDWLLHEVFAHQKDPLVSKTWGDISSALLLAIEYHPHKDTGPKTAPAAGTPTVKANRAETTRPSDPSEKCFICGVEGHRSRDCKATKCRDCGLTFESEGSRKSHWGGKKENGTGCPNRVAPPKRDPGTAKDEGKKRKREDKPSSSNKTSKSDFELMRKASHDKEAVALLKAHYANK